MFGFGKHTYQVTYRYYALGLAHERTVFLRARGLADIQKQLDKREAPWDVVILEATPL